MGKVQLDKMAPNVTLEDYQGKTVRLSDFKGDRHVILIFNRGFQ